VLCIHSSVLLAVRVYVAIPTLATTSASYHSKLRWPISQCHGCSHCSLKKLSLMTFCRYGIFCFLPVSTFRVVKLFDTVCATMIPPDHSRYAANVAMSPWCNFSANNSFTSSGRKPYFQPQRNGINIGFLSCLCVAMVGMFRDSIVGSGTNVASVSAHVQLCLNRCVEKHDLVLGQARTAQVLLNAWRSCSGAFTETGYVES